MNRICLDTSAYSNFKRGNDDVVSIVSSAKQVILPVIVVGELLTGFQLGNHYEKNCRELAAFTDHRSIDVSPIDRHVSEVYADFVVELRQQGKPIPTNDIWIAATASTFGCVLITYDRHFSYLPAVAVKVLDA